MSHTSSASSSTSSLGSGDIDFMRQRSYSNLGRPTKRGKLKKKSSWGSWKEAFYQIEASGMLLEFKNEGSAKPVRVVMLSKYSIKLVDTFTGTPNSFGLFTHGKDSIFLAASTETEMVEWVSTFGAYCSSTELEWKVDTVLEAMNDAMVISNANGIIIGVNAASLRMFGYTRSELMGQQVTVLMPEEIGKFHDNYVQRFNETNERRLIGKPRKMMALRKGGQEFCIELSLGLIPSAEGNKFAARIRNETNRTSGADSLDQNLEKSISAVLEKAQSELKAALLVDMEELTTQLEELKLANQKLKSKLRTAKRERGRAKEGQLIVDNDTFKRIDTTNIVVNERIARMGGSGAVVHLATVDGWQCAMKELDLSSINNMMLERFESEILLLESLPPHKSLVRYLFHEKTKTKLRLFMTRYSCDLASFLRDRREERDFHGSAASIENLAFGPSKSGSVIFYPGARLFTPKEIARLMLDIVSGLSVLHNLKIMHRDLKSDNIFVTLNEGSNIESLALGDFDTAKQLLDTTKGATTIIGTPGYIAPEVYSDDSYSYQADIWSFGMVCFELITLQRPPSEEGFVQNMGANLKKISETLHLSEQYSKPLGLMKDCLSLIPEKRPTLDSLKERLIKMLLKL